MKTRRPKVSPGAVPLGAALKAERDGLDMLGEDVRRRARVDPTSLSMFEQGKREPRVVVLWDLARGFNVPLRIQFGKSVVTVHEPRGSSHPQSSDTLGDLCNLNSGSESLSGPISQRKSRERRGSKS